MNKPRKAVALISGGLDSLLAARLMLEQGIHVEGINFYTGFCVEGHTHAPQAIISKSMGIRLTPFFVKVYIIFE